MLDETANQVNIIGEKANEMLNEARQLAVNVHQMGTQFGVDETLQQQIRDAQQALQLTVDRIEAVKSKIIGERKLAREKLDEVQLTVSQTQAHVDELMNQIKAKEKEIQRLSQQVTLKAIWPFGEISIPEPTASFQAGVLEVEVAGLYGSLATVKNILATARQGKTALSNRISYVPIEADSRLTELYIVLEAQKKSLSLLQEQFLAKTTKAFKAIFTTDNKRQIVAMASREIDTGFPDAIEEELFFDAISKIEETLVESIPVKTLELIQWSEQGLTGETSQFVERLVNKVNKSVDILMLDETQEAVFFRLLINLLIEAMKEGNTLAQLLSDAKNVELLKNL